MRITLILTLVLSACLISAVEPFDLQAEIDAACNGCTVIVPPGVHVCEEPVIIASNDVWQKVVTIEGAGHGHLGMADKQGGYQWTEPFFSRWGVFGSVLRCEIVLQRGTYPGGTTPKLYIRDLSLVGFGSGVAIDYGDGVYMFPEGSIEDVSIGNYDIGIRLRRSYYMSIDDVSMAGVGIGLQNIDSNIITVSGLNIVACGTGLDVTGNANSYNGGSVQACGLGMRFGGFGSTLTGFYFEQTAAALDVPGRGNVILGNYYAGNAGAITISGHNNHVLMSEMVTPVILTGNYNRVSLSAYGSCNDSGFRNVCERLYP